MYPVKKYLWAHSCVPGAVFKWRLDERIYRRVDMVSPILQTLLTLAEESGRQSGDRADMGVSVLAQGE